MNKTLYILGITLFGPISVFAHSGAGAAHLTLTEYLILLGVIILLVGLAIAALIREGTILKFITAKHLVLAGLATILINSAAGLVFYVW